MKSLDEFLENFGLSDIIFGRYYVALTQRILDEMKKQNISQSDLGKMLGKNQSEICRMLNMPQNLTIKTLAKISAALNFDVLDILNEKIIEDKIEVKVNIDSYTNYSNAKANVKMNSLKSEYINLIFNTSEAELKITNSKQLVN